MGIIINGIDQTKVILNAIQIIYSVLSRKYLASVSPVPLASNLTRMPKLSRFWMRGQQ